MAASAAQEPAQSSGDAPLESLDDILGKALTSGAPSLLPDPDDEPEDPDDDEDDGGAAPDLEDEETDEDAPEDSADELDTWLSNVVENPRRIAEIPRKLLPEAAVRLFEGVRAVIDGERTTAFQQGKQLATLEIEAQRLDDLRDAGDLDGFNEGLGKYPGGKQNFRRVLAGIEPVEAKSATADDGGAFQAQADELWNSLSAYPAAQAELRKNWNYPPTVKGIAALARDVARLEAKYERGAKSDPAAKALADRQAAQTKRAALPKAKAVGGGGAAGEPDLPNSVNDLLVAGFRAKRS